MTTPHHPHLLLLLLLLITSWAADLHVVAPSALQELFPSPIKAHLSPIGFRPLSGRLEGSVMLADPIGACSKIGESRRESEDMFVLADDTECLESVKARNIAQSGGYAGIIKQNLNNTLFDKEVSLVHIPILELPPDVYDQLEAFVRKHNDSQISLSIDFTDESQTHPINVEVWFSPTELASYEFLLEMKAFLTEQPELVSFTPHYALKSQRSTKNYVGCLSEGRYCPSEIEFEGKSEGVGIVEESLRQIIIWDLDQEDWWKYIEQFSTNCLQDIPDIFLDPSRLSHCYQNSLAMAGVSQAQVDQEFNRSFLGSQKAVSDNTYLLQERQLLIREQVSTHPTALVNKKAQSLDSTALTQRICKMEGDNPTSFCLTNRDQLSTPQALVIVVVLLAIFLAVAALYRLYMHLRMRREIKGEVDKTLEQYYRYIETFEEEGNTGRKPLGKQAKSKVLTEELEEVAEVGGEVMEKPKQGDLEMSEMDRRL